MALLTFKWSWDKGLPAGPGMCHSGGFSTMTNDFIVVVPDVDGGEIEIIFFTSFSL